MKIILKRKRRTRWGIDGQIYMNGRYVGDSTEHPRKRLDPGDYLITNDHFLFNRKNGPMANVNGEISVGKQYLPGVLLQTREVSAYLFSRIHKEMWKGREVWLEIV